MKRNLLCGAVALTLWAGFSSCVSAQDSCSADKTQCQLSDRNSSVDEKPLKIYTSSNVTSDASAGLPQIPSDLSRLPSKIQDAFAQIDRDGELKPADREHYKRVLLKYYLKDPNFTQMSDPKDETSENVRRGSSQEIFNNIFERGGRAQNSLASLLGINLPDRPNPTPDEIVQDLKEIRSMLHSTAPLKIDYLYAVEATPGNMVWFSQNGRYYIKGTVYDLYNGLAPLNSVDDVKNIAQKVNYDKLNVDPERLSSARIGTGDKRVVVYVDPISATTRKVIDDVLKYPDLQEFTFYFVVIPSDDRKSEEMAHNFYCGRQQNNPEIGNLLYRGELDKLNGIKCSDDNWSYTVSAAYFSQVDVLPFFVGFDGVISRGEPSEGLYNWLNAQNRVNSQIALPSDALSEAKRQAESTVQSSVTMRGSQQLAEQEQTIQRLENLRNTSPVFEEEEEEEFRTLDQFAQDYHRDSSQNDRDSQVHNTAASSDTAHAAIPQSSETNVLHHEDEDVDLLLKGEVVTESQQSINVSGFDMTEQINRYFLEAQPDDEITTVVNGLDRSTQLETMDNALREDALNVYRPEEFNPSADPDLHGRDKNLNAEIHDLKVQVNKIMLEFDKKRLSAREQYDREFHSYEQALEVTKTYGDTKKARRQKQIHERQEAIWQKYQQRLQNINQEEYTAVRSLTDEIAYLEKSLKNK